MKVGIGFDSHRLVEGRNLILGGVEIPYDRGLLGHSDADVLLHAVGDAILGALGKGDLGMHFPDTDPDFKDMSSLKLLLKIKKMADREGFRVNNVDATIVMEKPKLKGYIYKMNNNIAHILNINTNMVNVKATTNEGMGFTGRGEGVVAMAVVSIMCSEGT